MADFKLGRIKFKWRGDWATSTAYLIDDIVKYGGNTYVVTSNHTSQASSPDFYTDLTAGKYELHTEGLYFKGDWTGSTHYKLNDLVKYGAYQYRTTTQHTSTSSFDNTKFEVYAEGLQWEDTYNAGTTYQDGDVVNYGGYTYVYVNNTPSSGNTPTDNSYWDVVTTGYNNTGEYSHGTTYKTGDVVKYGGNSYVANANHTNQYPANTDGTTNSSYWDLVVKGFDYQSGGYSAVTTYNIGDVVRYVSTSYVMLKDRQLNVEPGTDGTVWQVIAQGDTGAVLSTRGDIIVQDASQATRLPIGTVGSVLTTDGSDPIWSNAEGKNVIYVANSGDDTNPGSQFLPFKTIYHALSVATSGDVVDFDTITGGTGGAPATYDITQTSTTGSGTGVTARVVLDGSSTPSITITNGGSGHAAGDVITFSDSGSQLGGASSITITVVSASIGDVVYVKNGVYRENLPLRIPAGVTVQGESLRGTEIRPASGTGHQIATVNNLSGGTGGPINGQYNYVTSTTDGSGGGAIFNVTTDSSSIPSVTVYHGGWGHQVGDTITISGSDIGDATDLTFDVATLENNNASNMFLVNNQTNIVQMSMKGLEGTPAAGGTSKAAVVSLDPSGSITTASPYVQNCSSVNANATGIQIDGNLHSAGNKSILANDYTQINSDGIGVHAIAGGRGEMVSVFTYYCDKSFYAQTGGFIRGLNCSSAYGEKGAVADGTLISEVPVTVISRGKLLKYNALGFVGAATETDVSNCISTQGVGTATVTGVTSGATATIFRTNISTDVLHIENITGSFQNNETLTITKEDSTTFQVTSDATAAETGQTGALIAVDSSDGTLGSANAIELGANIQFAGDSTYYRVSAVTETNTSNQQATIRLTQTVTSGNAIADNTATTITTNFSNVRLTGHDFLDIGTGDFTTTNYPGGPSQAADQTDEVEETTGGRVYFTSSDQKGDFRVGDLFRIEQATGVATLNADAFDLSGLTGLQLGSIGAELGATINEFSTDETLSGNSNTAVPTERATKTYVDTEIGNISTVLTVQDDSATTDGVTIGSDTLTFAGGSGLTSTVTNNTVTLDLDTTVTVEEIDSGSTITLDATTDIVLDAGGADILLKDDGTHFASLSNSTSDLLITSIVQDKDIKFTGNDGGGGITALTLDMSDNGKALFNAGGTFNDILEIKRGATSSGKVKFFEDSDNGTNSITIVGPSSVAADVDVTLPTQAGTIVVSNSTAGNDVQLDSFGVGTAASGTSGEIRATNNVTAYYSSDERLKENIRPITNALDAINEIRGVRYDWTENYIKEHGGEDDYFLRKNDVGVIAQEIEKILPEVVAENNEGYKAVRYERIIPLLIEAIKDLNKEIIDLKKR